MLTNFQTKTFLDKRKSKEKTLANITSPSVEFKNKGRDKRREKRAGKMNVCTFLSTKNENGGQIVLFWTHTHGTEL